MESQRCLTQYPKQEADGDTEQSLCAGQITNSARDAMEESNHGVIAEVGLTVKLSWSKVGTTEGAELESKDHVQMGGQIDVT